MPKGKDADRNAANQAAEEPVKSSGEGERKFPYEVLKANCMKLFHVTSSTFIGATAGKEKGTYSVPEMKSMVDSWLKKSIKKEVRK